MKYVIYLRVSTDKQVESGLGLQSQREICHRYIKNNGDNDSIEFIDEGYSGSLSIDRRPNLLLSIDALDKGDVLLIAKRDHIGRDPIINAMIERAVERKKARLISASGDVSDANDPSSILMKRMVDAFGEYERLIIGARTKAAMQVKKKKGQRVGYIPYGYRLSSDSIHIEPDEQEQKILQEIYEMKDSCSLRYISDELNRKKYKNRKGKNWKHNSVWIMVKRFNQKCQKV